MYSRLIWDFGPASGKTRILYMFGNADELRLDKNKFNGGYFSLVRIFRDCKKEREFLMPEEVPISERQALARSDYFLKTLEKQIENGTKRNGSNIPDIDRLSSLVQEAIQKSRGPIRALEQEVFVSYKPPKLDWREECYFDGAISDSDIRRGAHGIITSRMRMKF